MTIDLKDYYAYISEKNQQLNKSMYEIYAILGNIVKDCLGNIYKLNIYGSRSNGTSLPWSDIDFVIGLENPRYEVYKPLNLLVFYDITPFILK